MAQNLGHAHLSPRPSCLPQWRSIGSWGHTHPEAMKHALTHTHTMHTGLWARPQAKLTNFGSSFFIFEGTCVTNLVGRVAGSQQSAAKIVTDSKTDSIQQCQLTQYSINLLVHFLSVTLPHPYCQGVLNLCEVAGDLSKPLLLPL